MNTPFSQASIDFLIQNRLENDKIWFEERREQYNQLVLAPLVSLVEELTPTLLRIDDKLLCIPKVDKSISRIWRDARFSKDKSIFRDNMWCMFVRQKNVGLPEFFFVVTPQEFFYGCGYFAASSASMDSARRLILNNDKSFKTALSALEKHSEFRLEGDIYKRTRHPDATDNLKQWLDRKSICVMRTVTDFNLLYSANLASTVAADYKAIAPIYNFLMKAEETINVY